MVSVGRAITLPPFKDLTATFRMLCCAESLTCKKKRHKIVLRKNNVHSVCLVGQLGKEMMKYW